MSLLLLLRSGDEEAPPDPVAPPSPAISVREKPPLWLAVDATTPNGNHHRWAEDESDPANVFAGYRHSSSVPGGYETFDVTLPRKPGVDYPDMERLTNVRSYLAGGETVWDGRLERAPRVSGDQVAITPSAVGWRAHLEDNKTASGIYVDRDMSRWQGPGAQRRLFLVGANAPHQTDASQVWDSGAGSPSFVLAVQGTWASPIKPICEAWYDAGPGNAVGEIAATWQGPSDATWFLAGIASDDSVASHFASTGDVYAGSTGTLNLITADGYRYGLIQWFYNATPGGLDGSSFDLHLSGLAVHGDHGLPQRVGDSGVGYVASDVVPHAIAQWAPLLSTTGESIQPTGYVLPQLAFYEATTALAIVEECNRPHLYEYAVWDDRVFWFYQRGTVGRRWRVRSGAAQLEETGPQLDRLWNLIIIRYQDVDGTTRTVGPVGSGCDVEDDVLRDTDPENPATKLGIVRAQVLDMGTGVSGLAIEVGRQFLEKSKLLDQSGRCQLVGTVIDDRGVERPASQVRGGDLLSVVDSADPSYRRIVRCEYSHDTRTATVDLDAPPEGLDALLARLGLALAGSGF
jgi:hypothetical protein